jgi:hypothetical protein
VRTRSAICRFTHGHARQHPVLDPVDLWIRLLQQRFPRPRQLGPQDPLMIGIDLAMHELAPLKPGQDLDHALRGDHRPPRELGVR